MDVDEIKNSEPDQQWLYQLPDSTPHSKENWSKVKMSPVMRKPAFAKCDKQRHRSACTSTQSAQHLCCSLPG